MSEHRIAVRVGSKTIEKWSKYSIDVDMLTPSDAFHMTIGQVGRDAYELVKPETSVEVILDGVTVLQGFVEEREREVSKTGSTLEISGRDRGSRLVDESMPLGSLNGMGLEAYAKKVAGDWFPEIRFSDDLDRDKRLGLERRATAVSAAKQGKGKKAGVDVAGEHLSLKKSHPGEARWQVLDALLEELGLMAWTSSDGKALIIGLPDYNQTPRFHFFQPAPGSSRELEGNVKSIRIHDSTADRYSMITAVGAGRGTEDNYGPELQRRGTVANGPGKYGEGKDFAARKTLIVSDNDVRSPEQALVRAKREMAERDGAGHQVTVIARGHSQGVPLSNYELNFAYNTMAVVEDEEIGLRGVYLITSCNFSRAREGGEITTMRLVPKGTVLRT